MYGACMPYVSKKQAGGNVWPPGSVDVDRLVAGSGIDGVDRSSCLHRIGFA